MDVFTACPAKGCPAGPPTTANKSHAASRARHAPTPGRAVRSTSGRAIQPASWQRRSADKGRGISPGIHREWRNLGLPLSSPGYLQWPPKKTRPRSFPNPGPPRAATPLPPTSGALLVSLYTLSDFGAVSLLRGAVAAFGVRTYGIHVNGYVEPGVETGAGLRLWIARRAKDKATAPGKLDTRDERRGQQKLFVERQLLGVSQYSLVMKPLTKGFTDSKSSRFVP